MFMKKSILGGIIEKLYDETKLTGHKLKQKQEVDKNTILADS